MRDGHERRRREPATSNPTSNPESRLTEVRMSRPLAFAAPALVVVLAALASGQAPAPGTSVTPGAAPATGTAASPDAGPAVAEPPPPEGPRTFILDAKKTQLVIQVFKDGAAAAFAHDHTVHATELSGEVVADPAHPESSRVSVTVQTKSLVNDDPQVRRQFGLDPAVPEKDRRAIDESMKGRDQLDVGRYPTISFVSTAVEKAGDNIQLTGDFTLHGVTRAIKLPIQVALDGDSLVGDGKVRLKQSDWGITPYSAFLGAVKNKDEIVLNVHLVGRAK